MHAETRIPRRYTHQLWFMTLSNHYIVMTTSWHGRPFCTTGPTRLALVNFTRIVGHWRNYTVAFTQKFQCQWSNLEGYGYISHRNPTECMNESNQTKHNKSMCVFYVLYYITGGIHRPKIVLGHLWLSLLRLLLWWFSSEALPISPRVLINEVRFVGKSMYRIMNFNNFQWA